MDRCLFVCLSVCLCMCIYIYICVCVLVFECGGLLLFLVYSFVYEIDTCEQLGSGSADS